MRSVKDCLAKADEMERKALLCREPEMRAEMLALAGAWRRVAQQALWQDAGVV